MNKSTVAALAQINHLFYERYSNEFGATRTLPWMGWRRALNVCRETMPSVADTRTISILDLGCGNGRFGQFLKRELDTTLHYIGVDSSESLLEAAAKNLQTKPQGSQSLRHLNFTSEALEQLNFEHPIQLGSALGLLHHIPSYDLRRNLIESLCRTLDPTGLMILSFWQFGSKPRFVNRAIPWEDYNRLAPTKIQLEELEIGDYLLPWGQVTSPSSSRTPMVSRYCHYSSPEEAARLLADLPLEILDTFLADGKTDDLNLYYVLRKIS